MGDLDTALVYIEQHRLSSRPMVHETQAIDTIVRVLKEAGAADPDPRLLEGYGSS